MPHDQCIGPTAQRYAKLLIGHSAILLGKPNKTRSVLAFLLGNITSNITRKTPRSSPRPISTGPLKTLLSLHFRPINLVIYQGSYSLDGMGDLILEMASRLDAFSAYPNQTWLPSTALGRTTGTPAVCPLRSSRTRSSTPQISYARDR